MANSSYILDSEIPAYMNESIFRQLCTTGLETDNPKAALSGARLTRAETALNFGKDWVDAQLQGVYAVPFTNAQAVSAAWPSPMVKAWNARAAIAHLYTLVHYDRFDGQDMLNALAETLKQYTDAGGKVIPGHARTNSPGADIVYPNEQRGSIFDKAGGWASDIVPDDQRGYLRDI